MEENKIEKVVEQETPQEKDYYTKQEVEQLIRTNLLDYIKELNKDVKPKEPETKIKTIKELKF